MRHGTRPGILRALAPFLLIASGVVVADQATKELIRAWLPKGDTWPEGWDVIRIAHIDNPGAAFGILQGAGPLLLIAVVAGIALVIWYMVETIEFGPWYGVALGLLLGGAIGNFIDRAARGYVTDFIDPTHYPAFNLADSAIVIGVVTLVAATLFFAPTNEPHREADPAPDEVSP